MGLTNSQYDALMRIYSRKQNKNSAEQAARIEEAYQKIPQLRELDEISSGHAAQLARLAARTGQVDRARFLEKAGELTALREKLLEANGYPPDYLSMHYDCPDCRDTGYIDSQPCHCFRQQASFLLYSQSGIADLKEDDGFSRFSLSCYPDDMTDPATGLTSRKVMEHTLHESMEFVRCFGNPVRNLFFYGGTGLGKTFLSRCIAGELLRRGYSVIYYSAYDLFEAMARTAFGRGDSESAVDLSFLTGCDLLIIDDLGTELANAFVTSRLFLIINERINLGKSMIISTNLSLPVFHDTYSERTFSRISSSFTLLHFFGNDIRLQKKLAGGNTYAVSS